MNYEEEVMTDGRFGRENPFRVPDGYFDQLTQQVMSRLPERTAHDEQPAQARRAALRPLLYAAASVVVAVVIGVTTYFQLRPQDEESMTAGTEHVGGSYIDEAADYAMLDNMDIYACLSDN